MSFDERGYRPDAILKKIILNNTWSLFKLMILMHSKREEDAYRST
tara:strand:+ start:649 stop:783 length:135 start_codon:yes stop_codon:yes gene_type:complete